MSGSKVSDIPLQQIVALAEKMIAFQDNRKRFNNTYFKKSYAENPDYYKDRVRIARNTKRGIRIDERGFPIDEQGNRIEVRRGRPKKQQNNVEFP